MWTKRRHTPALAQCSLRQRIALLLTSVLCLCAAADSQARELIPPECVVLYTPHSDDSRRIAEYYVNARNIPPDHLIEVDIPAINTIEFDAYLNIVKKTVRRFLEEKPWGHTVRCLVTAYDFPLRVDATRPTTAMLNRATALAKRRDALIAELDHALTQFEPRSATTSPASAPTESEFTFTEPEVDRVIERYQSLRKRMFSPRGAMIQTEDPRRRGDASQLIQYAEGTFGWLRVLENVVNPPPELQEMVATARQSAGAYREQLRRLHREPLESPQRDELYDLTKSLRGAVDALKLLDADVRGLRGQNTVASLDNELALLWCDDYNRHTWQPNPAAIGYSPNTGDLAPEPTPGRPAIMMVARLDGPSPALVKRMIDTSIEVERSGLTGTVYIDARGVKDGDLYAVFDQNLLALADLIDTRTDLSVVVNRKNRVFQPGECPNAALYCGWHWPKKYTPAFEFVPGAVGVHISSFAFQSIKGGAIPYWGPGLLNDGVAATFGPTDEPFLHAFPLPGQFFGLLLTGQYSLAECFWYANPMTSWKMTLVGDPLYEPFRKDPQLSPGDVFPNDILPLPQIPPAPASEND